MQGLSHVQNIQKSGYVCSEISLYSEPGHVSLVSHDGDLKQLQNFLAGINIVVGPFTVDYVPFDMKVRW